MKIAFALTWNLVIACIAIVFVVAFSAWGGVAYYTKSSSFCGGSCHTMTEQYEAWKINPHHESKSKNGTQAECVNCHFAPGEKNSLKANLEGLRHLAAYLYDPNAPLPIRPKIPDEACLTSGCHADDGFEDKELQYTEKVKFKHTAHLEDKGFKGYKLNCDTCHFKVTAEKHFEVPTDICFLCHLKLEKPTLEKAVMVSDEVTRISFRQDPSVDFNQGLSRCDVCHEIPTKSLQSQKSADDPSKKAITHQSMQKSGVPCESCHFDVVKGIGEINTGNVVSNGCLTCHNRSEELLKQAADEKLMHDKHVLTRAADCFDCHAVVEHKNRKDHYDFVRKDCVLCHEDQHKYQKILLTGAFVAEGVTPTPQLMDGANTNCMACHVKLSSIKNHAVRTGSGEACAGCHTKEHRDMLKDWASRIERELKDLDELQEEAAIALADAAGNVGNDTMNEARALFGKGLEIMKVVKIGNGVHNKKYAIMLIDEVFNNFEDLLDLLDSDG